MHINVSRIIMCIGGAVFLYGLVTNSTMLSSRPDTSYQYMFLGGGISVIGLIFMLVDSKEKQ